MDATVSPGNTNHGPDAARIRAAFDRNPRKMTVQLARELGVPEV